MTQEIKPNARRSPSSGPMRVPSRWLNSPRWSGGHDRWSAWARALGQRRGLVAGSYDWLALVLARQLPLTQLLHQRWLVSSRWFQPQVKLAIQPILRQTVWREQLRVLPGSTQAEWLVAMSSGAQSLAPWPAASPAVLLQFNAVLEKWSREPVAENRRTGDSRRVESAREALTQTPLQLVFQRTAESGESWRESRHATVIKTDAQMLLKCIAQQAKRVETMTAAPATLVTRRPAAAAPLAVEPAAGGFQAAPVVHTAPWETSTMPPPAANIEQITDQVIRQLDRRVVAARERMGRV